MTWCKKQGASLSSVVASPKESKRNKVAFAASASKRGDPEDKPVTDLKDAMTIPEASEWLQNYRKSLRE